MDLLETPRLLLRPFGAGDAVLVHEIYSDPEVMRYVATGPMSDIAVTERLLADYSAHQLRLVNPAAARLLDVPPDFAIGRSAIEMALEEFLEGSGGTRIVASVAGHSGRWQVTHGIFRESGLAQQAAHLMSERR